MNEFIKEVFEATRENDVPIGVMCVAGSAADNAMATIEGRGGKFEQGIFTEEFLQIWFNTVQGILCEYDCPEDARNWFDDIGVKY